MDQQIVDNNAVSRRRLQDLVSRLDDASLQQMVDADWTVASVLAHLAFWDQSTYVRWEDYARGGELLGFPDAVIDVVNAANTANVAGAARSHGGRSGAPGRRDGRRPH